MNTKRMMTLIAVLVLSVTTYQAVIADTIIMSTAGSPAANDDVLYKLDGDSLTIQATHAPNYFDTIADLSVLPNRNFGVIVQMPSNARVWLLDPDLFNGAGSDHYIALRTVTNANGGSDGGMSNSQGEFFLSKQRGGTSDAARVNGLDNTLPVIQDIDGGYYDAFVEGDSLVDGGWVLATNRGGLAPGVIEVRQTVLDAPRLGRLIGTDAIAAIDANSIDHVGVGTNSGANSTVYSLHVVGDGVNLAGPSPLHYTNELVTDMRSLSNGDWVVALYDDRFANGGRVVILREDVGLNTLTEIDSLGNFGRIGALAVESDDDIIVGARANNLINPLDTLYRFNSTLDLQTSYYGFDVITNLIAIPVPEPASLALLSLGGIIMLRWRRLADVKKLNGRCLR